MASAQLGSFRATRRRPNPGLIRWLGRKRWAAAVGQKITTQAGTTTCSRPTQTCICIRATHPARANQPAVSSPFFQNLVGAPPAAQASHRASHLVSGRAQGARAGRPRYDATSSVAPLPVRVPSVLSCTHDISAASRLGRPKSPALPPSH